jgi:DNA-binding NarL/FixJ family response regulator
MPLNDKIDFGRNSLASRRQENQISIRVLLADDSEIMRSAIVRLLKEEPSIELVGEATSFAQVIERTAALKPNVLLLDLYMRDNHECPPSIVGSCISQHDVCVLAISLSNDEKAKALAESFGAKALLDKGDLFSTLLPAIKRLCADAPQTQPREKCLRNINRTPDHSQGDTAA